MPIEVACTCSQRYSANDELAGQHVPCPACGAAILVPNVPVINAELAKQQKQAANLTKLARVRFIGDAAGAKALMHQPEIARCIQQYGTDRSPHSARKELLANAVRVDEEILPDLGAPFAIHERTGLQQSLECYVFEQPTIDACVLPVRDHYVVLLSSAAIEKLDLHELEFVIGHEIGHVAYGHFRIPVTVILKSEEGIDPKHAIDMLAWHRHAEISADRAGLVCCGSLEVAASAFFKVLSGLSLRNLKVNPLKFAAQFDHLRDELFRDGAEDMWMMTHPLAPMRMKAMSIFWESEHAKGAIADAPGGCSRESCDHEIKKLLAHMDPFGAQGDASIDPLLEPFLIWGGLIIAGCGKVFDPTKVEALVSVVGRQAVDRALQEPKQLAIYRQRFQEALQRRHRPLSALDINHVLTCLIAIARAGGRVEAAEIKALYFIANLFGVAPAYVDGLLHGRQSGPTSF